MDGLEQMKERLGGSPSPTEDEVTKSIEQYTAGIPSSAILGIAVNTGAPISKAKCSHGTGGASLRHPG
jgi:hypothetical protein